MSECWMFYTGPTSRVSFTVKTSLDVFTLGLKQVWTSVLGDHIIYEMEEGTESGQQEIKTGR